jgi:hypothetical protein
MSQAEFDRIVHEARALQEHMPWLEFVVVGGTAASLHAAHRYSLDPDEVSVNLSDNYEVALGEVVRWEGWQTNRTSRPYVILGERHGVRLGIRQQIRPIALDTEDRDGLIIPTAEETLRIKAFLAFKRRAVRDYLDVAALADLLGPERTAEAISWLNVLYEGEGNQTAATKFAEGGGRPVRSGPAVRRLSCADSHPPLHIFKSKGVYIPWSTVRECGACPP